MIDLFGDTVTCPQTNTKSLINASHGFAEFWKVWPSGTRKVGKQQCLNKWAKYECCDSATLICQHVEWLKYQDDWMKGFIPMPLTYLNQLRWIDWEPPVKRVYEPPKFKAPSPPSAEIRAKIKELLGKKQ